MSPLSYRGKGMNNRQHLIVKRDSGCLVAGQRNCNITVTSMFFHHQTQNNIKGKQPDVLEIQWPPYKSVINNYIVLSIWMLGYGFLGQTPITNVMQEESSDSDVDLCSNVDWIQFWTESRQVLECRCVGMESLNWDIRLHCIWERFCRGGSQTIPDSRQNPTAVGEMLTYLGEDIDDKNIFNPHGW